MNWNEFWLSKWSEGKINFHQEQVESFLANYFPKLEPQTVFVPLCGKSNDLLYLARAGHAVVGVELSELACHAFFVENDLSFSVKKDGDFTVFATQIEPSITLYCGDFFQLAPNLLKQTTWIYDRAALIALPDEMRKRYAEHLLSLVQNPNLSVFLITLEYDVKLRNGPPFSVSAKEVRELYGNHFEIQELISEPDHTPMNTHEGVRSIDVCEHVFLMKRKRLELTLSALRF